MSIIIPTHNRAHLIRFTIDSVIAQTYSHWELIIVDDGSTDNTSEVIKAIEDPRISYHKFDHTGSVGKLRNYGMKTAKGAFIAFLDSDDLWREDKLQFQLAKLNAFPSSSYIISNGYQFGIGAILPPEFEDQFAGNLFLPMLEHENFLFYVSTLIFKKEIIHQVGSINEAFAIGGDIDFFFRLIFCCEGIFSNERLISLRKHLGMSHYLEAVAYEEYFLMLNSFLNVGMINKQLFNKIISKQYYKLGMLCLKRKEKGKALKNFLNHISIKPFNYKGWVRLVQAAV